MVCSPKNPAGRGLRERQPLHFDVLRIVIGHDDVDQSGAGLDQRLRSPSVRSGGAALKGAVGAMSFSFSVT